MNSSTQTSKSRVPFPINWHLQIYHIYDTVPQITVAAWANVSANVHMQCVKKADFLCSASLQLTWESFEPSDQWAVQGQASS